MVWITIVVAVVSFALGAFVASRGGDDGYADIDLERARIRAELEAEFDRRAGEYRERIEQLEAGIADAKRRALDMERSFASLVAAIGGSGAESASITEGIDRAVGVNLSAAATIEGVEGRLRSVIENLEREDW